MRVSHSDESSLQSKDKLLDQIAPQSPTADRLYWESCVETDGYAHIRTVHTTYTCRHTVLFHKGDIRVFKLGQLQGARSQTP